MKHIVLAWLVILTLGLVPAQSESKDPAFSENLAQRAEQGDADAQYELAGLLQDSISRPDNADPETLFRIYQEPRYWLEKSAAQGHVKAQFLLSTYYFSGSGVQKDDKAGIKWLEKGALQGFWPSQRALAAHYFKGDRVLQDYVEAYAWALHAATNGHPEAKELFAKQLTPEQIRLGQSRAKELQKQMQLFENAESNGTANVRE